MGGLTSVLAVLLVAGAVVLFLSARTSVVDPVLLFTGAGFFALYLPWGISPRTLNYSHYLFEAIPYACLSLGVVLDGWWSGRARPLAVAYLSLVVALFVLFFPFLTAFPVPADWFNHGFLGLRPWTWFSSWI